MNCAFYNGGDAVGLAQCSWAVNRCETTVLVLVQATCLA